MSPSPTAIKRYDDRAPSADETETATFGLGCFWGPDAQFGALEGVVRTRVGYAGGTTSEPTYHGLGDHTEAFQVEYNPDKRSFADLLDRVFRSHDPTRQTPTVQYQNIVFVSTADQREALSRYLDANNLSAEAINTRIEPLSRFYLAEAYHQKHSLRSRKSLVTRFEQAGYVDADIRESAAAAKLNAYAAGRELPEGHDLGVGSNRTVH